jgi:hypothetical protein
MMIGQIDSRVDMRPENCNDQIEHSNVATVTTPLVEIKYLIT